MSLLPSDRQSCLTLIAISAAAFPETGLLLCKLVAGCPSWPGGGCGVEKGLPIILLLVPHVKVPLPRRQLQLCQDKKSGLDPPGSCTTPHPSPSRVPDREKVFPSSIHSFNPFSPNMFPELITMCRETCPSGTSPLTDDIHSSLLFNKSMSSTFYV